MGGSCFLIRLEPSPYGEEEGVIFRVTDVIVFGSSVENEGSWQQRLRHDGEGMDVVRRRAEKC